MKDDFLKEFIKAHKNEFETDELPSNLRRGFNIELQSNQRKIYNLKTFWWIAASLILIISAYLIYFQTKIPETTNSLHTQNIKANKPKSEIIPLALEQVSTVNSNNIIASKHKNVSKIKKTTKKNIKNQVFAGLSDSVSAASRLEAIMLSAKINNPDDKLTLLLLNTFSHDENMNVRLAALEALSGRMNNPLIKSFLTDEFNHQQDPSIQLELLRIFKQDKQVINDEILWKVANNPSTNNNVKEQIYFTLLTQL